ncbi:MAG: 5-formyltetrahydrofolate cyclo-ligase [Magnetospirillum sp.]|nr:5-formyltetrahydrofolate cyclo-ligase [Magnetospirillum sp.]
MTTPDIPALKTAMRAHAVAVRAVAARRGEAAARALAELAPLLPAGAAVAGYWPMGDEIDPRPLLLALAAAGRRLALPVVAAPGQPLEFRAWSWGDDLEPGRFGTTHPLAHAAAVEPDLLLVPLLAFDRQGGRLGYGGGFYDRTLDMLRRKRHVSAIGIAFAAQEVAAIPHDGRDQRLDGVATEIGLLETRTIRS